MLPAPAATLREAYESLLAVLLVLGEAARVRMLAWGGLPSASAMAQVAAALGSAATVLLGRMAEAIKAGSAVEAEEAVAAGVGLVARLARGLGFSLTAAVSGPLGAAARDLNAENWAAASSAEAGPCGSAEGRVIAVSTLSELVGSLLAAACTDQAGLVAAALRPHLAGLVAAVAEATRSGGEVATSTSGATPAAATTWLQPVAELLGSGFDHKSLPADAAGDKVPAAGEDENAGANVGGGDCSSPGQGACGKGKASAEAARASSEANGPLVKTLLSAVRLVKAQEIVAAQAGTVAAEAWAAGKVTAALGGLELACLVGFKGVSSRGRSCAGGESFAAAITALRPLAEGDLAAVAGADPAAAALLGHKLAVLFPSPPRVTFDVAAVL